MTTSTGTRTVRAYDADTIYLDGLTRGPNAGWTWDGATLSHPIGTHISLTPAAAKRVAAAVAAATPARYLTGDQIQQLDAGDRDGWTFHHVHNEVHGMYVKGETTPGTCDLRDADVIRMWHAR
jgi:hypothetical protein